MELILVHIYFMKEQTREDEEIPDHFYDSDIASVNEKDFQSDNEPPKDIVSERKLLFKEKMQHTYKTILKVGEGIDRPAPYDLIVLRYKKIQSKEENPNIESLKDIEFLTYNLGIDHVEIEKLVTSMKSTQVAIFEVEDLEVSKKSNIKVLKEKHVYMIETIKWKTVIDLDGDRKFMKYVEQKGEGPNRVHKYDEVSFKYQILLNDKVATKYEAGEEQFMKMEEHVIKRMQKCVWKMLISMKTKQIAHMTVTDEDFRELEDQQTYKELSAASEEDSKVWKVNVEIIKIKKVDDFYMDGSVLKKTIIRGVSTAKPDSSSIIYYALKYFDDEGNILKEDACFNSDWWEDFGKLDELGCRKSFLDEYKLSKMLKASMKRMKPAEVAEVECRDMDLFRYGVDYEELSTLWPKEKKFPPQSVKMEVRVYNFTEGRTCFNMTIEEKVLQSRRKKIIAVNLLKEQNYKKAYKRFQNIVSFYGSGDINAEGYDQKVSALMNSTLCLMKQQKYSEMLPLCDLILQTPKHGYDPEKMKIKGPQGAKIEGQIKESDDVDQRKEADIKQNPKILDKCLYRKALALTKLGESEQALKCLEKITEENAEVESLRTEAEKQYEVYKEKSKKIYKSMFG